MRAREVYQSAPGRRTIRGMKTLALSLALTLAAVMSASAATPPAESTTSGSPVSALKEVETVERARFKAWIAADPAAIGPFLGDDLVYCHSTGVCQNKAEIIKFASSPNTHYIAMDVVQLSPRLIGGAVVINGKLDVRIVSNGKPDHFQATYTDVYAKRDGKWLLVSWQSTRVP